MRNPNRQTTFRFKQFAMSNALSAMKIGTDGVLLGAWALRDAFPSQSDLKLLDVGSGTGLIALMLAQRFANAQIHAVELDPVAAQEGRGNFDVSPWSSRLKMIQGDFLSYTGGSDPSDGRYDAIVSNPPYFTNGALPEDAQRLHARHQQQLSIALLISHAAELLRSAGRLALVLPAEQAVEAEYFGRMAGMIPAIITQVHTAAGKPPKRVLMEMQKEYASIPAIEPVEREILTLHDADGKPTEAYQSLVEPFYLRIH